MDDLKGCSARQRLAALEELARDGTPPADWLLRNLRALLEELVVVEPLAALEVERNQREAEGARAVDGLADSPAITAIQVSASVNRTSIPTTASHTPTTPPCGIP